MATMRSTPFMAMRSGSQIVGEEWPIPWDVAKREGDRSKLGLISQANKGDSLSADDVAQLHYHYRETGVGCAEHSDPSCLCDVVVTDPVQIQPTYDYPYADLSADDAGTLDWWLHVLAMHDALHTITVLATETNGRVTKWETAAAEGVQLLQLALDLDDPAMMPKDIFVKYGMSRNQSGHLRRKLRGQTRRR